MPLCPSSSFFRACRPTSASRPLLFSPVSCSISEPRSPIIEIFLIFRLYRLPPFYRPFTWPPVFTKDSDAACPFLPQFSHPGTRPLVEKFPPFLLRRPPRSVLCGLLRAPGYESQGCFVDALFRYDDDLAPFRFPPPAPAQLASLCFVFASVAIAVRLPREVRLSAHVPPVLSVIGNPFAIYASGGPSFALT